MPMFIRTPRNETVLRLFGPYPGHLNLLNRKETAVQREVRRGGLAGFEPQTQATLLSLVQTSRRPAEFFDVGSHIGIHSALVAAIFPRDIVHVTAFEATPDTADIASQLIERNHLPIRLQRCAVGDTTGTATLYVSDKAETSNSLMAGFRDSSASITVPQISLDDYCLEHEVQPSVIKIDVETYEAFVLQGAMRTLADARPAVVCELLPGADPEGTRVVLDGLQRLDYQTHRWVQDRGWERCAIDQVLGGTSDDLRDWLFTPEPLTDEFHSVLREWQDAIAACDADQTLLTDPGVGPPPGWGAPHRRQFAIQE